MMKTQDYLDAAKAKLHLQSDYKLAQSLGVSREYVSQFRLGKTPFSDEVALKIANILEIDPIEVIARTRMERAKNPEIQAAWTSLLEKISKGFEVLISCSIPRRRTFSG